MLYPTELMIYIKSLISSGAKHIHCKPLAQKSSMVLYYQPNKEIIFSKVIPVKHLTPHLTH